MITDARESGDSDSKSSEITTTVFDIATLLMRKRKFIGLCLAVTLLPALIVLLLMSNQYRSTATILPASPTNQLTSLSAMVGLSMPQEQDESSSELYPEILRSRQILSAVLKPTYQYTDDGALKLITLTEYFGEDNPDKLCDQLAGITSISTSKTTGTITVSVDTKYPELSQSILNTYLSELEHYNMVSRKSKAREVEQYLARELAARRQELAACQDSLKSFQESNLNWSETSNPYLLRELAALQREVAIKEQAYAFLSQQYEASKLKVQEDTPIVRVLDKPNLPTVKSSPFRLQILTVIGLLTFIAAILIIAIGENLRMRARATERQSYHRFRENFATVFPTLSRRILPEYTAPTDTATTPERNHRGVLVLHKQEKPR
ncbi:hypothetical protein C3F09_12615 [candidate division GN15 bacterium]|uniref:Polysaccharide chain length determinant N-terminal domain-containing protein n=1 Tax=candidate division GN15 bacterium TaxID=2072418 RepID=A0A855X342_9BACT|nr:MAG: hypothetical protein C3F09_12615 [candidate division GN15 bacterium]